MSGDQGTSRRDVLRGGAVGLGAVLGAVALTNTEQSAADARTLLVTNYYLILPGIKGAVTQKGREGWIELRSLVFGGDKPGSGSASVVPLTMSMYASKASPKVFAALNSGQTFSTATIKGYRPDRAGIDRIFITITLTGLRIVSYAQSCTEKNTPTLDKIATSYTKIDYSFPPNDESWTPAPP